MKLVYNYLNKLNFWDFRAKGCSYIWLKFLLWTSTDKRWIWLDMSCTVYELLYLLCYIETFWAVWSLEIVMSGQFCTFLDWFHLNWPNLIYPAFPLHVWGLYPEAEHLSSSCKPCQNLKHEVDITNRCFIFSDKKSILMAIGQREGRLGYDLLGTSLLNFSPLTKLKLSQETFICWQNSK